MTSQRKIKGPLFVNGPFDSESDFFIRAEGEDQESFDIACTNVDETGDAEGYANRLVACFNACEGLQDPIKDIPRMTIWLIDAYRTGLFDVLPGDSKAAVSLKKKLSAVASRLDN